MELKKLRCPECGANFESDEKVSFCSYCGAKLYFDDGTRNINHNFKTEDIAKIKEIEFKREKELQNQKNESKSSLVLILFCIILIIGIVLSFKGMKKESIAQEEELQSLVNEIYIDIDNGDYDKALIKAKSLHYTEGWSSEIEEKWDDTRKSLIKIIEGKMK